MEKGRILLVDDQEAILTSLTGILSDEGHEVTTARDGQEALHYVQSDVPDVVFLDVWIPGIDGLQTLRAIKRIAPDCAVVMMSGHGTIETAVKAIKLGAADYLEKPINLEDVLHLVERSIQERSSRTADRAARRHVIDFVGRSQAASRLRRQLKAAASSSGPVWIVGPDGVGKEFAARVLHSLEGKDRADLIKVRCAELDPRHLEELFVGRANGERPGVSGKVHHTHHATLLLLRVDRTPPTLTRPLFEMVTRAAHASQSPPVREGNQLRLVFTALNREVGFLNDPEFPAEFRELSDGMVVSAPPLRERRDDIPLLAEHFLGEACREFEREPAALDETAMARLIEYPWPGNVKELKILMEHVAMTGPGTMISANDLLLPGAIYKGKSQAIAASIPARSGRLSTPKTNSISQFHATLNDHEERPDLRRQKTLKANAVMYGQGLHTGVKTGLTLSPLPPGSGVMFGHITSAEAVPAVISHVESTEYATCLGKDGAVARTIEHLMAVFHIYGLTNVLVKISGEVPIMDGSALEFCRLVETAEIIPQDELIEAARVTETIELPLAPDTSKFMRATPADHFEIEYFMEYPQPIGAMHIVYRCDDPEDFKKWIAPARTFGFVRDMKMMDEMGLAGGGRLSNVVLVDDERVVNPPLRFPDEFVRHKVLDIIGDFYLLGMPFLGKITARQTGHSENIAMLKLINQMLRLAE